jgi:hypothetical protein
LSAEVQVLKVELVTSIQEKIGDKCLDVDSFAELPEAPKLLEDIFIDDEPTDRGGEAMLGTVKTRKRDSEGNPVGGSNMNPLLDNTREYEVEFPDGSIDEYEVEFPDGSIDVSTKREEVTRFCQRSLIVTRTEMQYGVTMLRFRGPTVYNEQQKVGDCWLNVKIDPLTGSRWRTSRTLTL